MTLFGKPQPLRLMKPFFVAVIFSCISLIVGAGLVVLPPSIPFGIVGIGALILFWVMPELRWSPIALNRYLLLGTVAVSLAIPNYFALVIPGVPYFSLRRMFWFSLAAVFMLCVSGSVKSRDRIRDVMKESRWLSYFILTYFAVRLVSTVLSNQLSTSLNQDINFILAFYIPFFALIICPDHPRLLMSIVLVIVSGIIFDLIIAIPELKLHKPVIMMLMPSSAQAQMVADNPILAGLVYASSATRNGLYRANSIFNTSLSYGEFAAMSAPFGLYLLFDRKGTRSKILGAVAWGSSFVSVVLAGARGGYVCFLVATGFFLVLWTVRWIKQNPQSIAGALFIVLAAFGLCGVVGSVLFVGEIHKRVLGGGESSSSTDARSQQWHLASPRIQARPAFGYGPGMSADVVGWAPYPGAPLSLDSYLIGVLVDTGVLGFLSYYGALITAIVMMVRVYLTGFKRISAFGNPLASALLAYATYRVTLNQIENNALYYQLLAMTMVTIYGETQRQQIVDDRDEFRI